MVQVSTQLTQAFFLAMDKAFVGSGKAFFGWGKAPTIAQVYSHKDILAPVADYSIIIKLKIKNIYKFKMSYSDTAP